MALPKPPVRMSVAEYLESEKDGTVRHEYLDGEVYAMSLPLSSLFEGVEFPER